MNKKILFVFFALTILYATSASESDEELENFSGEDILEVTTLPSMDDALSDGELDELNRELKQKYKLKLQKLDRDSDAIKDGHIKCK